MSVASEYQLMKGQIMDFQDYLSKMSRAEWKSLYSEYRYYRNYGGFVGSLVLFKKILDYAYEK